MFLFSIDRSRHNMYEPLNILILVSQSSLCEMIIQELPKAKQEKTAQESWFIRWLWRTTGGAALYALAACLVRAVSERCCLLDSSTQTNHTNGGEGKCGPGLLVFGRCCGSSESDMSVDIAERGVGTSGSSNSTSPTVKTIVASFNAWLFADSKVLWAVLVSKIFEEVRTSKMTLCQYDSPLNLYCTDTPR